MSDRQLTQDHLDLKIVNAMQDLFADSAHWARGHTALDESGLSTPVMSPRAFKFCFLGAYFRVIGSENTTGSEDDLKRIFDKNSSEIVNINDRLGGYPAVIALLKSSAARLEAKIAVPMPELV